MSEREEKPAAEACEFPANARARAYKLGRRQITTDENRARILEAARELVLGPEALRGLTVDAVAKRAGVARMTVYHQFKSKLGLLEAIFDEMASKGGMERMRFVYTEPDPLRAVSFYIQIFCDFWASDRGMMRRLGALATLDPEFGKGIRERSSWRTAGCRNLAEKLSEKGQLSSHLSVPQAADILFTLTNFHTFDALAGEAASTAEVTERIHYLIWKALELPSLLQSANFPIEGT